MKQKIKQAFSHPLISGSTIILVGSFFANLLNFGFNLAMGRLLLPSDYGNLAALISIFNIFSVFSATVITVFTKFTASYVGKEKEGLIGRLIIKGTVWVGGISLLIAAILLIFTVQLSDFLKINDKTIIYLTILSLVFSFLSAVTFGVLQGLMKFFYFSFLNIFSSFGKLVIGVMLILLGLKVVGAMSALLFSTLLGYILAFLPLYRYMKRENSNGSLGKIYRELTKYAFPVFLSGLGMTSLISSDIILVKHFFDPVTAGQYAALSIMGRSIFYVVGPITFVLFPIIAQKIERKEKLGDTILLSVALVGLPCLVLSGIYFIFPDLIRLIFFPASEYASLKPYLGPFSIFICFYSFAWLLNSLYLSVGKTSVFIFTLSAAILEIVLITFFHENIMQIVLELIVVSFVFLASLLLYYRKAISVK